MTLNKSNNLAMASGDHTEQRLDRTAFKRQTATDAADQTDYWRQKSDAERLRAAYHLSLRAWGYDPSDEPRLDRTQFSMRKLK